ncbi:Major facilitator super domain-containing protein 8, partial [Parelaphostrongylus tenuis]
MEKDTDWKAVKMAGIVTFLSTFEYVVFTMSEWAYMHKIDPKATPEFYGNAQSASRLGHAIFAVVFAFWAYKIQST